MKSLELVFFDAGGGHRSAANALSEVARQQGRDWDVRLMNLQELLDEMDIFRKLTGIRLQDIYNLLLRKGWTLGSPQLLPMMHLVIKAFHSQQVKMLEAYWQKSRPDLVVSVIPNFNKALFESLGKALPGVPMVTILTDMADYPPNFWIEPQPQYLICGTPKAREQAYKMGHTPDRVFLTSGMILNPKYYQPVVPQPLFAETESSLPTALIMFGGEGSAKMLEIVRLLNASSLNLRIVAICGKNEKLRRALEALPSRLPLQVEGFTKEVPRYMKAADFFIGKPGPGSISEAVIMGLPVIVECNAWTLPQERYNAEWVEENGVGIALKSFSQGIVGAVAHMVDPAQRANFKSRVNAMNNRAVFEIPEILDEILKKTYSN